MKRIAMSLTCLLMLTATAQTQHGVVKTIGRPNAPGVPLANVTIQMIGMVNPVVSSSTGEFHLSVFNKKDGDEIKLLNVRRKGYELKDRDLLGRPLVFSSRVPLFITMINSKQLAADKKRIEENARRTAEGNYRMRLEEIEKKQKEHKLTEETYRIELKRIQEKYDRYMSLVSDMADRYARTDYDQLDSVDRKINICIENGDLDKADSLIHTVFDPETVLQRNQAAKEEIQQRMAFAQKVIDKANADKEMILRDIEYAKRISSLSENLANEYLSQGDTPRCIHYLEKSLEIKTIILGKAHPEVKKLMMSIERLKL